MQTNNPAPASATRKPRFRVMSAGKQLPAISAELDSTGSYQADKFSISVARHGEFDARYWGEQDTVPIEIQFGFAGMSESDINWTTLFVGEVDKVELVFETGLVTITGRDLTHRLIDAKTQEPFLNQTSSQIATTLAGRHGLTPKVTATTTPVNRYYGADHDHITLGSFHKTTTEWDLLTFLAQRENFDVFVDGVELHFQPRATVGETKPEYVVRWVPGTPPSCNVTSLKMDRALTLASDIIVKVHSWHSGRAEGYTKIARLQGSSTGGKNKKGSPQTFVYTFPNLSPAEAQNRANAILADLSKHERVIEFDAPGELVPTPRSLVQLAGTGSSWDQTYFVDQVRRTISISQGFVMHVRAKNHSPQSETQVS